MELIVVFSFNTYFIQIMVLLNKADANAYGGKPELKKVNITHV